MNLFRKILFPFAIIYCVITSLRNFLYDTGVLKSYSFNFPVIVVGNLSVGGTGKTPQIEYLIRLLSEKYKISTLSRGYKRKSKGFILADANVNVSLIGDEPFQFNSKFPNIQVAVDVNRKNGIEKLLSQTSIPDVILLDDAFQHRKVEAGFYILLTSYDELYSDDFQLPTGNLRENRSGAKRANVIIVTKCPINLSNNEKLKIRKKLAILNTQELYFTTIEYDDFVYSENEKRKVLEVQDVDKLLLAGIAKPQSFFAHLHNKNAECLVFPDHHYFSDKDILEIKNKAKNKIIITTEKDYVRLKGTFPCEQLFYLPMQCKFLSEGKKFDSKIFNYVKLSSKKSGLLY